MHWNMACLASALLPLLELQDDSEKALALMKSALDEFPVQYAQEWQALFRKKLGLLTSQDEDIGLLERLLQSMHDSKVDFTSFFRQLGNIKIHEPIEMIPLRNQFIDRITFDQWLKDYLLRLHSENSSDEERKVMMDKVNPKFVLRNHLAQKAIEMAQQNDFSEVHKLHLILNNPFDDQADFKEYANPPPPNLEAVEVSCSS
jgi:uncharacterized protein YdiU (UPF0061 family)